MSWRRVTAALMPAGLFAVLTVIATWPQAWHLASRAVPHQDIYFNMWRLRWIAHALTTPATRLFDANIFFPERDTLALSDAVLLQGVLAMPWLKAGAGPLLVQNTMILAGMGLSALGAYALARHLTGSRGAGILAGIVFAYAPYRIDHVMHLELQWAVWSPLAFLALHRLCDTGALRYGAALGACLALQMLSSIYYGVFLLTLIGVAGALVLPRDRVVPLAKLAAPIVAGVLITGVVCAAYAWPYLRVHQRMGDRPEAELVQFSAMPSDYLRATPDNWLYGQSSARGHLERHLFPGLTAFVLAIVGLLLTVPRRRQILYLLLLVFAFEASLGTDGYLFSFLHRYVPLYRGLRAAARFGAFVLLFLGILAGYGYQALAAARPRRVRVALLGACMTAMLLEYRVHSRLVDFPTEPTAVYRMLARQPPGVVAEFPVPTVDRLPGPDPEYAFMSTFAWFPTVNGYSGVYPASYLARLERLRDFPSRTALEQLRRDGVRYVIVHGAARSPESLNGVRLEMEQAGGCAELGSYPDGKGSVDVLLQCR